MNRRAFFRSLFSAVGAALVVPQAPIDGAVASVTPSPIVAPIYDEAVKRWSARLWMDVSRPVWWGRFSSSSGGSVIEIRR